MLECAEICLTQGKMTLDVQLLKTQPWQGPRHGLELPTFWGVQPEGSTDMLDRGLSFPPLLGGEEAGGHGSPSTGLHLPRDDPWDLGTGWAEGLRPEKPRGGR